MINLHKLFKKNYIDQATFASKTIINLNYSYQNSIFYYFHVIGKFNYNHLINFSFQDKIINETANQKHKIAFSKFISKTMKLFTVINKIFVTL